MEFIKVPTKNTVSKLAPIVVVMLPEGLAFEAQAQHLNGKRDRFIYKDQWFCFKKINQNLNQDLIA